MKKTVFQVVKGKICLVRIVANMLLLALTLYCTPLQFSFLVECDYFPLGGLSANYGGSVGKRDEISTGNWMGAQELSDEYRVS